jgi:uncharacterized repeat protein (TIGR01451 family)
MTYTMRLDETLNEGECPYGATNPGLCDDKVDFLNNTPGQVVFVDGAPYTLNILGFVPGTPETCQYSPTLADYFITGEIMQNDACVFAQFVAPQPAISISKSPDLQKIAAGDDANFEITVQNTGNVGLEAVTIADPLTPDCEREVGGMKAGATLTYACTAYGVEQDFENVATVSGVFSGATYQASDSAVVDVLAPDSATLFAYKYNDLNGDGQRARMSRVSPAGRSVSATPTAPTWACVRAPTSTALPCLPQHGRQFPALRGGAAAAGSTPTRSTAAAANLSP